MLRRICETKDFKNDTYTTGFIEANQDSLMQDPKDRLEIALEIAASHYLAVNGFEDGWRMNQARRTLVRLEHQNKVYNLDNPNSTHKSTCAINGTHIYVSHDGVDYNFKLPSFGRASLTETKGALTAPMPGIISKIFMDSDSKVKANEPLLILEAMKMETEVRAPNSRTVVSVSVKVGDSVAVGETLISVA